MLTREAISRDIKLVRSCSIWRALYDVGDVPTLLILQSIWMGRSRFNEINDIACLPKAVLSSRLKRLRDVGILEPKSVEAPSSRVPYKLTHKGRDLFWVVLMLLRWETRWSLKEQAPHVSLIDKDSGRLITPEPFCATSRDVFNLDTVSWTAGPGIGLIRPHYARRRQSKIRLQDKDIRLLFTASAEILGDRWATLILRSLMTGLYFFDQILKDLAIATNILSARLSWLQDRELISPERDASGAYRLSDKGKDFFPVLVFLQEWGDQYYATPEGAPVVLYHKKNAQPLQPIVVCKDTQETINLGETQILLETHKSIEI